MGNLDARFNCQDRDENRVDQAGSDSRRNVAAADGIIHVA